MANDLAATWRRPSPSTGRRSGRATPNTGRPTPGSRTPGWDSGLAASTTTAPLVLLKADVLDTHWRESKPPAARSPRRSSSSAVAGGSTFATPQSTSSACGVTEATPSEDAPKHRMGDRCVDHAVRVVVRRASAGDAAAVASAYLEAWRAGYQVPWPTRSWRPRPGCERRMNGSAPSREPTGSWRSLRLSGSSVSSSASTLRRLDARPGFTGSMSCRPRGDRCSHGAAR
jgi:hypothetical protein